MSNFNFTSQICTTKEQSERLLALGLKKETADMEIHEFFDDDKEIFEVGFANQGYMEPEMEETVICSPAWSLHRLIELCGIDRLPICFGKKGRVRIRVSHIHPTHDGRSGYNHYDSLIDCIEWLIKEGYFNKEYLERI